ncbi:response regulator [Henriciella sp.]|uniref:response regulator n=1 Tax=Henriciella sp. TaxID=1968823 RepID=UPI0026215102|nr:response regulator [Henriciella sp.]
MSENQQAESDIAFLRRYARAVIGQQTMGDKLVDALLESLPQDIVLNMDRLALFARLDAYLTTLPTRQPRHEVRLLASDPRRALLLTALEGFSTDETAAIMKKHGGEVDDLLVSAEKALLSAGPRKVFIIEDEPLVAAHIAQTVRGMGHQVLGTAATSQAAIAACKQEAPDLLLADIMLADGSSGAEACSEITNQTGTPTIFITAYPQKLLRGISGEPAYLIQKPFTAATIKAVISQVLIQQAARQK